MVACGVEGGVGLGVAVVLSRCKGRESCLSIASDGSSSFRSGTEGETKRGYV